MLLIHETHELVGREADEFERRFREEWMPALAEGDGARLLWYLHHAHGSGPAYHTVTITAVRDGAAWERLAARVAPGGDLHDVLGALDARRHGVSQKVLVPLDFSPLASPDLDEVPAEPDREHDPGLFMEDTAWPNRGRYDEYLEKASTLYVETLRRAEEAGWGLLRLEGAFSPAHGAGVQREVVLWQRVTRPDLLTGLLTTEVPLEHREPGTWMHDALEARDRWESRLLRTAPWSPLE